MNDPTTDLDTLIQYAGAVKALDETADRLKVGGHVVLFGTPATADLSPTKDFFTKSTDYGLDVAQKGRVRWHHGLDPEIGRTVLGLVDFKAEPDDVGIWAEGWIGKQAQYAKKVAEWVKEGRAGWSTGVAAHTVGRKAVGDSGAHEITEWCLGADCSITLTPADPRQVGGVLSIKSLMDTPGSGLTQYDRETCPECGHEGAMPDPHDPGTMVCPSCNHKYKAAMKAESSPYGKCPECGAPGVSRERRPGGNDTCANGHTYPSRDAIKAERNTDEVEATVASPSAESSTDVPAVAAKTLVDRSARLVADLDELVPLWERAHAARLREGRDLSPEKLAALKALAERASRLTVAVRPRADAASLAAALAEADELLALL
jgi:ssDNA-binding Zn-finger/Zn-ribbon topoisomerase 1